LAAPAISIVLPARNREALVARAIESVLCQSFGDFELLLVDDHSTDRTRAVFERYVSDGRVRVTSSPRSGAAAARNHGLDLASGRLIAFQDSDDEWAGGKLETAVDALDRAPASSVFYSDMARVRSDGSVVPIRAPQHVTRGVVVSEETLDYQVRAIGIGSAVIRRECFDVIGGFDERLARFSDLDLFIRLSAHFDFVHEPALLVDYHATRGISTDGAALVAARRYLLRKYRHRLRGHHVAYQYVLLARALADNGQSFLAKRYAARAVLASPRCEAVRRDARSFFNSAAAPSWA
jgi:glycosyltransferase involved in cell wall biosynthesis